MAFKFNLDVVLRLRESIEDREFRELEKIQFEITKTISVLHAIDDQRQQAAHARYAELQKGVNAVDLQGLCDAEKALDNFKLLTAEKLKELGIKRTEQLEVYRKARMNREILSELKSQKKEAHDQRVSTAQQKQIDDLFISRRGRN